MHDWVLYSLLNKAIKACASGVSSVTVDNSKSPVEMNITFTNGETKKVLFKQPASISSSEISEDDKLKFTLVDGTKIDCGVLPLIKQIKVEKDSNDNKKHLYIKMSTNSDFVDYGKVDGDDGVVAKSTYNDLPAINSSSEESVYYVKTTTGTGDNIKYKGFYFLDKPNNRYVLLQSAEDITENEIKELVKIGDKTINPVTGDKQVKYRDINNYTSTLFNSLTDSLDVWKSKKQYKKGDIVRHPSKTNIRLKSIDNFTSGTSFDSEEEKHWITMAKEYFIVTSEQHKKLVADGTIKETDINELYIVKDEEESTIDFKVKRDTEKNTVEIQEVQIDSKGNETLKWTTGNLVGDGVEVKVAKDTDDLYTLEFQNKKNNGTVEKIETKNLKGKSTKLLMQGDYEATKDYKCDEKQIDLVVYNDIVYIAKKPSKGQTPPTEEGETSEYWVNFASNSMESASGGGGIFFVDVTPIDSNANIQKIMKANGKEVEKIISDTKDVLVKIVYDRDNDDIIGCPFINDVPCTVNENHYGEGQASLQVDITGLTKLTAKIGNVEKEMEVSYETPPVVKSIMFPETYPSDQIYYKDGDKVEVKVTVDKEISKISVYDYQLAKAKEYNVTTTKVGETEYYTNIEIDCADRSFRDGTGHAQKIKLFVQTEGGSKSQDFISDDSRLLDNTLPYLTINVTYPNGQVALKNSESADVMFTSSYVDEIKSITSNYMAISPFTFENEAGSFTCTRTSGDYVIEDTVIAKLKYNNTNREYDDKLDIPVVNVPASVYYSPLLTMKSGEGNKSVTESFNQKVKMKEITSPSSGDNLGTVISGATIDYSTSYTLTMSCVDSDTHANTIRKVTATVVGMSGIEEQVEFDYKIKGFTRKSFTMTYPALSCNIGVEIVNLSDVTISGYVNSNPPLAIMLNYGATTGDGWSYSGTNIILPESVREFGYGKDNIIFTIEEY